MSTRHRPGEPGKGRGSKQAYRVVHQPVSRGLAVFADAWLSGWLAEISADLRETPNGSASEVLHDDALYKSTYFNMAATALVFVCVLLAISRVLHSHKF